MACPIMRASRVLGKFVRSQPPLDLSHSRRTVPPLLHALDPAEVRASFTTLASRFHFSTSAAPEEGLSINRSLSRSASTAFVTKPSKGIFSWLTGYRSSSPAPLVVPLQGVILPHSLPDHVEPGKTLVTTLANGVKIASETSPNPAASIGLFVDCGSMYETPDTTGATQLLQHMAFKTTKNKSHLRVVREVEALGGNIMASASREQMIYTYDAPKIYVPEMVELLIDCVKNPAFLEREVDEQILKVKADIAEAASIPLALLLEALHKVGYSGALANALLATESEVSRLNSNILENFVAANYTAPRIVLAASGVEHEEMLKYAQPLLADLPSVACPKELKSTYIGGDYRRQGGLEATHFVLAFEAPGGWNKVKDVMALNVLQMLMGGGQSFSAGGLDKGRCSRLYLGVLNEYPQIQSFSAFISIYKHTGLFGIQATTGSYFVSEAIDIAIKELIAVATPGEVNQVQLDRAKQSTKCAILMNSESRMVALEDIGRQILTYGERKPLVDFLKAVDEISLEDICSISRKLISSPLTMASHGDVVNVPSYDSVRKEFSE